MGALVIHLANVYLAGLFQGDPCTWYVTIISYLRIEMTFYVTFQVYNQFFVGLFSWPIYHIYRNSIVAIFSSEKALGSY